MQPNITRRFLVCAAAVLGTTLVPWAIYHKGLDQPYEMKFGLDLKGGASITYRVRAEEGQDQAAVLKDAIRVTQFRVDKYGVSEVNIVESGKDQFTVELPGRGKEEIDRIKALMNQMGNLEFRIVALPDDPATRSERAKKEREKEKYVPSSGYAWVPYESGTGEDLVEAPDLRAKDDVRLAKEALAAAEKEGKADVVAQKREKVAEAEKAYQDVCAKSLWTGKDLDSVSFAKAPIGEGTGYEVYFSITPGRKTAFGDFTGDAIAKAGLDKAQMAIILNGKIHTAPNLNSKLPGSGKIYSQLNPYTLEGAQVLTTVLQSGSLQVRPEEISSFVVGPQLGEDAVRRGTWAIGISTVLVIITMALYYYGAGWVANLAVVLNLVMTLGIMMFLNAGLSLPGIAGLVLTLGMAVDANILVNERIREEKAAGKGLAQAIVAGYDRAWITILDSNLTTILAGLILYWVGSGPIRGFALTLVLGLAISMFTACYVTRTIFLWGLEVGLLKDFSMMPVMALPPWRYTAQRKLTIGASALLIVLGTGAFLLREKHEKYDLEFIGGQRVVVALHRKMTTAEVKERLAKAGAGDASVRTVRGRGSESASLDLSTESDSFEISEPLRPDASGNQEAEESEFAKKISMAFGEVLLPPAVEGMTTEPKEADGAVPFRFTLNFATSGVTMDVARETIAAAPLLGGARELKVEPAKDPRPGASSFAVTGKLLGAESGDPALQVAQQVRRAVAAKPGLELSDPVPQNDFIGPGVANRLRQEALIAILLSTIAQIFYLRFRFRDYSYGFAAAIIVAHNVLITLGAVAVADALGFAHVKINLPVIASFLTLIGYSVNDTIVVFDRIRENLGRMTHPTSELIDKSISDTLARSIRTSITVFLVAATLFGANWRATSSIEGFSFVMVVGVVTSAYASIFISSPLLLFLPVYSRSLERLGRPAVLGLLGALFAGLAMSFTQEGAAAIAGVVLATLLPGHFLVHLVAWLKQPDPDRLIREAAAAAAVPAQAATA